MSVIIKKDLTNQKFGKLIVLERLPKYQGGKKTYYRCECDCDNHNERIVETTCLTSGKISMCKSCAETERILKRRVDYVGQKYGRLTIVEMLYNYGEQNKTFVKCICDCANEKIAKIGNVIHGNVKSCGCLGNESRHNITHYFDITGERFGMLTVIELSGNKQSNGAVLWKCRCDCGNCIETTYTSLKSGHTLSCGCRKNSKWEDFISCYLSELNIDFIREHRFETCRNKKGTDKLPFDFYLPSFNLLIEYDGLQHYEPIKYWGGEKKFKITQENDQIKTNWCKQNNIQLLRLPYTLKQDEIVNSINIALNL